MKKIVKLLNNNKKVVVGFITSFLLISVIIFSLLITNNNDETIPVNEEIKDVSIQYVFSEEDITRREWLKLYAEKFGMYNYITEEPFFTDVSENDEMFSIIQACVENDILKANDEINLDNKISLREAIIQLGRTYGESYISKRMKKDSLKDEDYLNFMLQEKVLEVHKDKIYEGFGQETAESILNDIFESYMARDFENNIDVIYAQNTIDLSQVTDYTYEDNILELTTDKKIKEGQVIILGESEEWSSGLALKTININNIKNNKYNIEVNEAKFEEIFESIHLELDEDSDNVTFIPAEGVKIIENPVEISKTGYSSLYNAKAATFDILYDKDFNVKQEKSIKLEVDCTDEEIILSEEWEALETEINLSKLYNNNYEDFPSYFINEKGQVKSVYESGINVKGSVELSNICTTVNRVDTIFNMFLEGTRSYAC